MKIPQEIQLIRKAETITDGLIPLHDCTFIIPVRIESEDRRKNFTIVYDYLSRNFETNIIIYECSKEKTAIDLIRNDVTYVFDKQTETSTFHRTKYLNRMLSLVNTAVTVNYDIDVVLPIESYLMAYKKIVRQDYDLVYPFAIGKYQKKVNESGRKKLLDKSSVVELTPQDYSDCQCEYGHCQFFNTQSYKTYGWENEHFVSYGPEDRERYERFKKLERNVTHLEKGYVYHIEHSRGTDSNEKNPFFEHNNSLYKKLGSMNKDELTNYYKEIDYIQSY
jgi:hypothetical protein